MARKVYQINEFPNSRYKFDIIDNARNGKNCVDKWQTIFEREKSKGAVSMESGSANRSMMHMVSASIKMVMRS